MSLKPSDVGKIDWFRADKPVWMSLICVVAESKVNVSGGGGRELTSSFGREAAGLRAVRRSSCRM